MSFDVPVSSTRHEEFVKPALTSFGISNSQSMNFDDTIRPGSRLATSQSMQFPPVDSRPAPPSRIASNYSDETSKLSISADRSSYIRPISRSSVPRSPVHAHAPAYHTISTTTRIPLKPDTPDSEPTSNTSSFSHRYSNSTSATTPNRPLSAMSGGSEGGALSVSREEALAMIKERRSRSRSMKEGMATPRKPSRGPTPAVSTGRSARSTSRGRPNTGRV